MCMLMHLICIYKIHFNFSAFNLHLQNTFKIYLFVKTHDFNIFIEYIFKYCKNMYLHAFLNTHF